MKAIKNSSLSFTLVELLVVVAIIGLLIGVLVPAVMKVPDYIKRGIAKREITDIDMGLRGYYREYNEWPSNLTETTACKFSGDIVRTLEGNNKRNLRLVSLNRKDRNKDPINPWGDKDLAVNPDEYYYYVKVDVDFDDRIEKDSGSNPPTDTVLRQLIVWTEDPKKEVGSGKRIIRSW
ncbi:type II secretion system protein [Verrucomicrobiota bacterium]